MILAAAERPGAHPRFHVDVGVGARSVHAVLAAPGASGLHFGAPDGSRPGGAPLGEDLDDARGGLRAVQRGGRGALDDLDALDVGRVDVVERAHGDVAAPSAPAIRRVRVRQRFAAHAHPVDVDERVAGETYTALAPQADDLRLADGAAPVDLQAGRLRLQEVGDQHRPVGNLGHVDLGDGVADLAPAGRAGRAGHDDLVQAERLFGHGEVLYHGFAGGDRDLRGHRPQTDALGANLVAARRHVKQHVASVLPGQGSDAAVGQEDLDLAEGRAGTLVRHLAGDASGLLGRGREHRGEQSYPEEEGRECQPMASPPRRSRGGRVCERSIRHNVLR